jgi:hypothetical protein
MMYAERVGVWRPSSPDEKSRMNRLTEGCWLGEIICTLAEQLLRLHELSGKSEAAALIARGVSIRSVVRNSLDLPVALHFMELTGNHPHGHFGMLGAISSAMGIWEMWPTVRIATEVAMKAQ